MNSLSSSFEFDLKNAIADSATHWVDAILFPVA